MSAPQLKVLMCEMYLERQTLNIGYSMRGCNPETIYCQVEPRHSHRKGTRYRSYGFTKTWEKLKVQSKQDATHELAQAKSPNRF